MKKIVCIITVVSLILTVLPAVFAADDMVSLYVRNHSFEEGELGLVVSGDEIPGWTLFGDIPETTMTGADYMYIEVTDITRRALDKSYSQCKPASDGEKCLALIDGLMNSAMYLKSDEIRIKAGIEYTLSFDLWSDWRGAHGLAFFNSAGKLYKNGSWIDATDANLRTICGNGYTASTPPPGITAWKSGGWNRIIEKYTAPAGAVNARILLFSAVAANANSNYDNISLEFSRSNLKADADIENLYFENGTEGWSELFGADIEGRISVIGGAVEISGGEEIFLASAPAGVYENVKYSFRYDSDKPIGCRNVFFNEKGEIYSSSAQGFVKADKENLKAVMSEADVQIAPEGVAYTRVVMMSREEAVICGNFELTFTPPAEMVVSAPVLENNGKPFASGEKYEIGDSVRVKCSAYNGADEDKNIKVIICNYAEDGSLSGIKALNFPAKHVDVGEVNTNVVINEEVNVGVNDGYIRVFVVDSFLQMLDYVKPLEHSILIGEGE